jgi:GAF domain-containing protein
MSPSIAKVSSSLTNQATWDKLLAVGQSLATVHDLKALLKEIVAAAGEVLKADVVVLYEYRADLDDVTLPPAHWGNLREPGVLNVRGRPHRESAVFKMLDCVRPVYAVDAMRKWRHRGAAGGTFVEREGIVSSAAVRLAVDDKSAGVLFVNYRTRHAFTPAERSAIELFAAQAAVAIQNTRLIDRERRLRRQADTLRDIAVTMSVPGDLRQTAGKILDAVYRLVRYSKATMQLIQDDTRSLLAIHGFDERAIDPHLLRPISQDALITRAVQSQQPVILSRTVDEPDWEQLPFTRDVRSWIGLPLVYGGQTIGLITLDHTRAGTYTRALARTLIPLAQQAAVAIKNAQLLDDAKDRIRDLQILNEIAQLMAAKLNTTDLLQAIVDQLVEKLGCRHCAIFAPESTVGTVQLVVRVSQGEQRTLIEQRRFAVGEGLVGWAFEHGQSILLADARADQRFAPATRNLERPRSMLIVPIRVGDQTIGVISADRDEYGKFSASDLSLVEALARQTGIAIQRNSGLKIVQEIGDRINEAQQVRQILEQIVSGAIELTHTTSGVIYLINDDGTKVIDQYIYPLSSVHPAPRMNKADGSTRRVIATGEVLIFSDVRQDDVHIHPALRASTRSMIAVPLKREARVVGVLYLNDEDPHDFTEAERSLLLTLANQAATALHKAQLLDLWREQVARHKALNNVITNLTGTLAEFEILEAVARLAFEPLDCTQCSVFRVEATGIVVRAAQGNLKHHLSPSKTFRLGQGVAGWVAKYGQSALVPDTGADERFDPTWSSPPPQSLVVVPIFIEQKVYGVISIEHSRQNAFTVDDQQLLETLARQAGQALRSARRIHELQVLYQAGQLFSRQLNQKILFENLLDTVNDTLKCAYSTLFLVEPATGDLVAQVRRGRTSDLGGLRFPTGHGLAGTVAQTKQALIVPDLDKDPRATPSRTILRGQPHSVLIVPLILSEENLIGVLSADKDVSDGFNDNDRRLLETLSAQAAIAIENTRLFEEQKQQASELELLHQISANWMTLDLTRMLRLIVEGALKLTDTDSGIIYQINDDGTRIVQSVAVPEGFAEPDAELSAGGLTRQIIETGEPVVVTSVSAEPRVSASIKAKGIQSFIGQPLKVGTGVIGVLYLNSTRSRQFGASERKLITTLALQAASALDTARLYDQLNRQIKELHQVVQEADTQQVLERVLEGINQLLGEATSSSINLYDTDTQSFYSYNAAGALKNYLSGVPPRVVGTSAHVMATGQPLYLDDVQNPPSGVPTIRTESIQQGVKAFAALPLRWREQIVGMLFVNLQKSVHFTDEIKRILELFASQAATAIVYTQLYEDLQRRARYLDALNQISQQAKELMDLDQLFARVVNEARTTLRAERCTLFVLNDDGVLVPRAMEGVDPNTARLTYQLGEGLAGWVAQEGHSERVRDAQHDPRFVIDATVQPDKPRSMVLAPLWVEGRVDGVLSADRENGTPFDEDDQRFVETLAVQAGILWRQIALRVQRMAGFKRQRNPYVVGEPIRDPEGFFGRREIIQQIVNGIYHNSFILHGERRIGKTSILFQIKHRLKAVSEQADLYYFLPIFASLQPVPEVEFFDFLSIQLVEALGLTVEVEAGWSGFEALLELSVAELERLHPGRKVRVVFLLDEMDQFTAYSSDTHNFLRAVMQSEIGAAVKLIMAGVLVQRWVQDQTSPWYNQFQEVEIPGLDEGDCRQLLIEPVRGYYRYAPEALNMIIERADFKPLEIQRLGWNTVNVMLARVRAAGQLLDDALTAEVDIEPEDVLKATQRVLAERDGEYRALWAQFDAEQQLALRVAEATQGVIDLALKRAAGQPLFARDKLYNLTRPAGSHLQITYLFSQWLKGLTS